MGRGGSGLRASMAGMMGIGLHQAQRAGEKSVCGKASVVFEKRGWHCGLVSWVRRRNGSRTLVPGSWVVRSIGFEEETVVVV